MAAPDTPPRLDVYPFHGRYIARAGRLKRLMFRLLPRHTLIPFLKELQATRVRLWHWRTPRRYRQCSDLLVNLGAGDTGRAGWVNVDIQQYPGINCVYDCRKHLPFPDRSVRGIFCEHFFEHIDYTEEIPTFVSECYRVLQPGGVLRIVVPDAALYLHAYMHDGWEALRRIRPLHDQTTDSLLQTTYHTRMELLNMVFRQGHQHKFAYDFTTLAFVLRRYGFATVQQQAFGVSLLPELAIDQAMRASESLYVDAQKAPEPPETGCPKG